MTWKIRKWKNIETKGLPSCLLTYLIVCILIFISKKFVAVNRHNICRLSGLMTKQPFTFLTSFSRFALHATKHMTQMWQIYRKNSALKLFMLLLQSSCSSTLLVLQHLLQLLSCNLCSPAQNLYNQVLIHKEIPLSGNIIYVQSTKLKCWKIKTCWDMVKLQILLIWTRNLRQMIFQRRFIICLREV